MEVEQPKLLYRITDVVELTGYSKSFLYQAINRGELKVIRKGDTIRIAVEALTNWIYGPDTQ